LGSRHAVKPLPVRLDRVRMIIDLVIEAAASGRGWAEKWLAKEASRIYRSRITNAADQMRLNVAEPR
jgi:hypothetical protein